MEVDEEMEVELVFEAREIDIGYEFEAPMFFDFTREESLAEAREAEQWFETAQSYPLSPFAAKLVLREDSFMENINTSENYNKAVKNTVPLLNDDSGDDLGPELSTIDGEKKEYEETYRGVFNYSQCGNLHNISKQPFEATGLSLYSQMPTDKSKAKGKSSVKANIPRSSTLMKPTASLLAKQNRPLQAGGSRFQIQQNDRNLWNCSVVESQAAKRQKLEGGHLPKADEAKQQTNFIHKAPKRDGFMDKNSTHAKLRLTIPREPDLETAHRAERLRPKNSTDNKHVPLPVRRFKARPLNKKILEAPTLPLSKKSTPKLPEFQEFHLKTLERAKQHASTVPFSSLQHHDFDKGVDESCTISGAENGKSDSRRVFRPNTMVSSSQNGINTTHVFKARPLNKKIFSSKGDIGVFRNIKRETTVPMEFNFHTEKRIQHNLPTELFSKLSLTSRYQPDDGSGPQLPQSSCLSIKGSKENRFNPLQTEHQMTHLMKERSPAFGGKQLQCGNSGCINEVGKQRSMRSLGIR